MLHLVSKLILNFTRVGMGLTENKVIPENLVVVH